MKKNLLITDLLIRRPRPDFDLEVRVVAMHAKEIVHSRRRVGVHLPTLPDIDVVHQVDGPNCGVHGRAAGEHNARDVGEIFRHPGQLDAQVARSTCHERRPRTISTNL